LHDFDAGPATTLDKKKLGSAPASTIIYSKLTFLKQTKVNIGLGLIFSDFFMIDIAKPVIVETRKLKKFVAFLIIHLCLTSNLEPWPQHVTNPRLCLQNLCSNSWLSGGNKCSTLRMGVNVNKFELIF
jgi:hypothetical protein